MLDIKGSGETLGATVHGLDLAQTLEDREIERLFAVIERMKSNGTAIIYISHRLEEIRDLADRCTVLRDGKVVAVRTRGTFSVSDLIEDMTGRMAHEHLDDSVVPGAMLRGGAIEEGATHVSAITVHLRGGSVNGPAKRFQAT